MELVSLHGVGAATISKLNQLSITSVEELLNYLPRSYCDYDSTADTEDYAIGEYILLVGKIGDIRHDINKKNIKARLFASSTVSLIWFNQPYIASSIIDTEYCVYGRLDRYKGCYSIANPLIERMDRLTNLKGIQPIYKLGSVMTQSAFRKIMRTALSAVTMPKFCGIDIDKAIRQVHFPTALDDITEGQKALVIEQLTREFIAYKLNGDITNSYVKTPKVADISSYFTLLPYELTPSQAQAVADICTDMVSNKRMNRLVMGDVGSGKSIVAFVAMLYACEAGYQSVMVAPTEILAKQHYDSFIKLFPSLAHQAVLLSGTLNVSIKQDVAFSIANNYAKYVFATHAGLNNRVPYASLGLMIIDEVQKFGVSQKAILPATYGNVDTLIMSATPLPRTLSMLIYGDLSISKIYRREGSGRVKSYVIGCDKVEKLLGYIASKVAQGQQAYIVCPRLESSDGVELLSAKSVYKELAAGSLQGCRLGLIYGSMKDDEKTNIMHNFASGMIDVLVATSVIEVGIDNPRATVIAVLGANHFGLATLHQLRGRVGRGSEMGEAFLVSDRVAVPARLTVLQHNNNGEQLAIYDAELRGMGQLLGTSQSGNSGYERYKVRLTPEMVDVAKSMADSALKSDIYDYHNDAQFSNSRLSIILN